MLGYGATIWIISNEKINDVMKISKYLEESSLLIKDVSKTIKNEAKEQKEGFLGMLLVILGASVFGYPLTGKVTITAGEDALRAGLMPPHSLTNFEIQKSDQNKPKFNSVNSRNNLPKIKDRAYVINFDEY